MKVTVKKIIISMKMFTVLLITLSSDHRKKIVRCQ